MLTSQSCNYLLKTAKTEDGKTILVRYYPDLDKRQDHQIKCVFKYQYKENSYQKYSGNIKSDTIDGMTYIQFDSLRIYLSGGAIRYKNIFSSGLLSSQMIYCENDSLCRVPKMDDSFFISIETGKQIPRNFHGWTGPEIFISNFKEITNVSSSPRKKQFRFNISHMNGFSVYVLELTNNNKPSTFDDFINGARVTFLKYGWSEI
jgi:hypothetical protein